MKAKKTMGAAVAALLTLLLFAQSMASASAASGADDAVNGPYSITVNFVVNSQPVTQSRFSIWKVGKHTDAGWVSEDYVYQYHVLEGEGEWSEKASTLLSYLLRDEIKPYSQGSTGDQGQLRFDNLERGIYLMSGEASVQGSTSYTPTPSLIVVPSAEGRPDVEVSVKHETHNSPSTDTVRRSVFKVWNDDGYTEDRPHEVTVDLLCNGERYDTVTLTAEKSWRHTWSNLPAGKVWAVVERELDHYSVVVERKGITFVITNTWQDDLDPDDPPPLIDIPDEPPPEVDPPDEPDPVPSEPLPDEPDPIPSEPLPDEPVPEEPPEDFGIPDDPMPLVSAEPGSPAPVTPPEDTDIPDNLPPLEDTAILPQTGQLWWPVIPMMLGGLVFSTLGWKRCRSWDEADDSDET